MSTYPALIIERGEFTPDINFDLTNKVCSIKGRCIPENPNGYFGPILTWIDNLTGLSNDSLNVICKIPYFNTASAKYLMEIFKRIDKFCKASNNKLEVQWYFEEGDDDMKEAGEHFADLLKVPFNYLEVDEDTFES